MVRVLMVWVTSVLVACNSRPSATQQDLPAELTQRIEQFRQLVTQALAVADPDPASLPRCPKATYATVMDRPSIAKAAGQPSGVPPFTTVPAMATARWHATLLDLPSWRTSNLEQRANRAQEMSMVVAAGFGYFRESRRSVLSDCGLPDRDHVATCTGYAPGHHVLDVVVHLPESELCAIRVEVDGPRRQPAAETVDRPDLPLSLAESVAGLWLRSPARSEWGSRQGEINRVPCDLFRDGSWQASVNGVVICPFH